MISKTFLSISFTVSCRTQNTGLQAISHFFANVSREKVSWKNNNDRNIQYHVEMTVSSLTEYKYSFQEKSCLSRQLVKYCLEILIHATHIPVVIGYFHAPSIDINIFIQQSIF